MFSSSEMSEQLNGLPTAAGCAAPPACGKQHEVWWRRQLPRSWTGWLSSQPSPLGLSGRIFNFYAFCPTSSPTGVCFRLCNGWALPSAQTHSRSAPSSWLSKQTMWNFVWTCKGAKSDVCVSKNNVEFLLRFTPKKDKLPDYLLFFCCCFFILLNSL